MANVAPDLLLSGPNRRVWLQAAALWRQGMDTLEIAKLTGFREQSIYIHLPGVRAALRDMLTDQLEEAAYGRA